MEFSVYPLYSPQSLLAEGTANYGIEMAFPGDERVNFERHVLYPIAGIDPGLAAELAKAQKLLRKMRYATTEGARRYLDGEFSRQEAIEWVARYRLVSTARAEQSSYLPRMTCWNALTPWKPTTGTTSEPRRTTRYASS